MIKVLVSILLISFFVRCSTSNKSKESVKQKEKMLKKTIFYLEDYPIINSSYKEDVVFLNENHLKALKGLFDNDVKLLMDQNQFILSEKKESNYKLIITKFDFKEFKIQVDGPQLNVSTLRVDYRLETGGLEKNLFEEVNKESLEPFKQLVFQEMCNLAANNIVNKLSLLSIQ